MAFNSAVARVLVDPQFIFRMEHVPANLAAGAVYRLTDMEIATRLSFFLWSSIPDDTLLDLAIAGRLSKPAVLERETRRMLADPKSKALIDNFAAQWMHLRELDNAQPDSPDFDGNLRVSFEREMQLFFDSILREDRSLIDLLDADYTFVDERLARHYGIPGVTGSFFRRVPLAANHPRRGVLGKGSVLLVTSAANRTSPVERGQWVLENLLGSPAPNPPPGVETNLDQKVEDTAKPMTLRQRMDLHRRQPTCASCHSIMDPVGFSLENFDLVGKWREQDGRLADRRDRRHGRRHAPRRSGEPAPGAARPLERLRVRRVGKAPHLCRGARGDRVRHAGGAGHRPQRRSQRLPFLVARRRCRP